MTKRTRCGRGLDRRADTNTARSIRFAPVIPFLGLALLVGGCAPYEPLTREARVVSGTISPAMNTSDCNGPGHDALASVVRVSTDAGAHGSGVVIADGRVLTAAHVVLDARMTSVGFETGFRSARVLALDPQSDLALLAVDTTGETAISLARTGLQRSEEVWAIGFPMALGKAITRGEFQHAANGKLYTSAWITSGNSGGGLFRCTGGEFVLAGILRDYVAYLRDGEYVNADQSTSVPMTRIREFVAQDGLSL